MVNLSDYAGDFLKGQDLQGREHQVTIDKIVLEDVGGTQKLVLHMLGRRKKLPLNKINVQVLMQMFGDNAENCRGGKIVLFPEPTRTPAGVATTGVRIKAHVQSQAAAIDRFAAAQPASQPAPQPAPSLDNDEDDEIRF